MNSAATWDVFCRVVDNFGDIGVCWRLAADLAARGISVRLRTDDATALAWMAPEGAAGVQVLAWDDTATGPGDVVIEAFGCDLPPAFVQRMVAAPPVWVNLEYLSAEDYVERVHGLRSPQRSGLTKYFFYPGFTPRTGGLLREAGLAERQRLFDREAWLTHVLTPTLSPGRKKGPPVPAGRAVGDGELVVSLFCYEQAALPALLTQLSASPTLLLATVGQAARQVHAVLGDTMRSGSLRALALPALSQVDYDHLLWASDWNFVRGEDSFVRAQWAAKPFVWQIYPQEDGVHLGKLEAFLARLGAGPAVRDFWRAWNGAPGVLPPLPSPASWRPAIENWRAGLLAQRDLSAQLIDFVAEKG